MSNLNQLSWSTNHHRWFCIDDGTIDEILASKSFITIQSHQNYSKIEDRFNIKLPYTKAVLHSYPLANEGQRHRELRERMSKEINQNSKRAIGVFVQGFSESIRSVKDSESPFDIAQPFISAALRSNLALANLDKIICEDYSDIFLALDDSRSIKSRLLREKLIERISLQIRDEDASYKIALITVGVNALISTALHSMVRALMEDGGFKRLIKMKFFPATGLKSVERECTEDIEIRGTKISKGHIVRMLLQCQSNEGRPAQASNKKFFAAGTPHACPGMSYSIQLWGEFLKILEANFTDLRLRSFEYREPDPIFQYPTLINVESIQ